jgi:hypothetical protein
LPSGPTGRESGPPRHSRRMRSRTRRSSLRGRLG